MGTDEVLVDLSSVAQALFDRFLGNFVENESLNGNLGVEHLKKVPTDRLSLSIFVGREIDFRGLLYSSFEFVDPLLFVAGDNIERCEVAIDVNTEAGPLLLFDLGWYLRSIVGEIADVSIRS